jgi:hypothetical protein
MESGALYRQAPFLAKAKLRTNVVSPVAKTVDVSTASKPAGYHESLLFLIA